MDFWVLVLKTKLYHPTLSPSPYVGHKPSVKYPPTLHHDEVDSLLEARSSDDGRDGSVTLRGCLKTGRLFSLSSTSALPLDDFINPLLGVLPEDTDWIFVIQFRDIHLSKGR